MRASCTAGYLWFLGKSRKTQKHRVRRDRRKIDKRGEDPGQMHTSLPSSLKSPPKKKKRSLFKKKGIKVLGGRRDPTVRFVLKRRKCIIMLRRRGSDLVVWVLL